MVRSRACPSRPSVSEAVGERYKKGAASLDDASHRQENHEAPDGPTSFETRERAPQDEEVVLLFVKPLP
jgi:hypothetical protein